MRDLQGVATHGAMVQTGWMGGEAGGWDEEPGSKPCHARVDGADRVGRDGGWNQKRGAMFIYETFAA